MKRKQQATETIKTTCFYSKNKTDVYKIIEQSFRIFVKNELVKL